MINRSNSTFNEEGNTLPLVQVPARKSVALVGKNGSGKSSIRAFLRSYAREVLLDGENIKSLKLEWVRSQIGLLTQEPALLSLSIRDNIAYGRPATIDQIEEAAKSAPLAKFSHGNIILA